MCDSHPKMMSSMALLVLALTTAFAAPAAIYDDVGEQVPQKRAALVLDRLLIALQKALREDGNGAPNDLDREEPRTAPLRRADFDFADMVRRNKRPALVIDQLLMAIRKAMKARYSLYEAPAIEEPRAVPVVADWELDMSAPERRADDSTPKGRVVKCFFNAVTCF